MFQKPFSVTGLGKTIHSDQNVSIPILEEFGINNFINLHVIPWHTKFDALIGSHDFRKFKAKIDYSDNTLELNSIKIPFYLEFVDKEIYFISRVRDSKVTIPVSIESGDVIIPELEIKHDLSIPECITTARNGFVELPLDTTDIFNLNFKRRMTVKPFIEEEVTDPPKFSQKLNISALIRTDHLNSEEKQAITSLCKQFRDIFYDEHTELTFANTVKHKIRTTDEQPVYVKSFRHPHSMKNEIQSQIQKLLDSKIIRPSISPYSAPVWIVPKKSDASGKKKFRMVIDYRKLNEKTIEDKYPLPRIDEILDNLGRCTYFTTLDLAQGFHQIEMDEESIEKTAFTVNNGHYEYVRVPFGLKNAPSTFQRVMDNVLREFLHKFVFVYMDDVVIFSRSMQEHINHIKLTFKKMRQFNLKIQLDKSEFFRKEVSFLGHVISPEGIKPNPAKIESVVNYPIPKTTKEIKSFLGLVGYYRKFISDFAKIVSPLTKCLKKGSKINITDPDYVESFELCKELLTNAPILAYPDFKKQFTLTTDASNVSIAGVLSQSNRPIAYYSRTLNSAEKNYSTIEKELLAILDSTKHFRPYLFGQNFVIETDHNPLVWLYKIKEPNSKLVRWKLKLEEFNFTITYKRGKENKVADALSRVEINNAEDNGSIAVNVDELPEITDQDIENILNSQLENPDELPRIIEDLQTLLTNPPDDTNDETVHSTDDDNGKAIPISEQAVNIFPNRIIFNTGEQYKNRFTKPFNKNTYNVTIRPNATEEDITTFVKETFKPNVTYGIYFIENNIRRTFEKLCKNLFNYSLKLYISNTLCRDVTDVERQSDIVTKYHDETHNGITETYNHLRQKYFWPNMKQTITNLINVCDQCLLSKYERHPYKLKFSGPLLAKRPFEVIHIDSFSFLNSKFLTIIDLFSRYAQAYLVKDGTSLSVLNKLRHYFGHHNIPQKIVCDEGREFQNNTFKEFCKMNKIELHYTTVNNPSSNSPIERFHSTIVEKLRILKLKNPKEIPSNLMISAILIYNQSIHSSTGFSPFHLLYGPYEKTPNFDLDMTIFEQYNEKRKQEILPFYDQVYLKNKQKAQDTLDRRNETRNDPPDVENMQILVKRNKPSKVDPRYEKITVKNQDGNKISGTTEKCRNTTAHISKAKKLRNVHSLQVPGPDSADLAMPGPSGQNRK